MQRRGLAAEGRACARREACLRRPGRKYGSVLGRLLRVLPGLEDAQQVLARFGKV